MSQQYQNSPSQAHGAGFGQPYYPSQSPYGQRPPYPPAGYSQQPAHAPPPFQPVPNPSLNLGRFDTNAQTPQPFPFPAGTFPPEMLKQFASAGIPPPPPGFPPMPIPNLNFPQFPPQSAFSPSHQQYHQPNQVSDDGADAYDPRFPQSIMQNVRAGSSAMHPATMTPETARNQTQEGGSASSHTVSHGEYAPEKPSAYRIHFPSNLDGATLSTESQAPVLPTTEPRPASLPQEQASHSAPSNHLSSSGPVIQPPVSADALTTQQAHNIAKPDNAAQTEYKSKSAVELRSMAKGALLSLAPHGILYDDLVREGIYPDLLKELYAELGMKSGPSPSPSSTAQPPASNNETPVDNSASQTAATAAASPSLERKDRIAQLLAAKSGRSGPIRVTSGSKLLGSTSLADGSSRSASISSGAAQIDGASQGKEQARTQTPQNTGLPAPSSSSLRISPSLAAQASSTVSSPFTSGIPGLAMMSPDEESHFANRPAKRPLESDFQTPAVESGHKRRNTGLSSKTDGEAMDIDDGSSDEGEVVESPQPSKAQNLSGVASSTAQISVANIAQPRPAAATTTTKLTPAQMAEKAEMLKAKFLKQRARQKALQDGLPTLDAEVSKTETALAEQRASLDQVRQSIAGLEAGLAKLRDDERSLVNKIQSSEKQLQEGLSGREKYTTELQNMTNEQSSTSRATVPEETPIATGVTTASAQVCIGQETAEQQDDIDLHEKTAQTDMEPGADVLERTATTDNIASSNSSSASQSSGELIEDRETADEAPASGDQSDDEGEYVPEELQDAMQLSEESPRPDAEDSDGSASMSDSASEMEQDDEDEEGEYEPPEDEPTEPMEIDDGSSVDYEPTDTPIELDVPRQGSENAEEAERLKTELDPPIDSAFATPTTEISINGTQNSTQHEDSSVGRRGGPPDSELYRMAPTGPRRGPTRNSAPATPNSRMNRSRPPVRPLSNDGQGKSNSFSAYQSPLTSFPAYKFHQQFDDNAKDGYRSLTYSNRIDPAVPLCPTELAGETCEDSQCEEQHFRHLGLNDDKILAQMSSASEFKDKEVRERYVSGLKDTIASLRANDIKAFEEIAKALAKYRREFLAEL